jgi:hypothetical protein
MRFGMQTERGSQRMVGVEGVQTHVIRGWVPMRSAPRGRQSDAGAWRVIDNLFIHAGPDRPNRQSANASGGIELSGGPRGFYDFNSFILNLSGTRARTREDALYEVGYSGTMRITFEPAQQPRERGGGTIKDIIWGEVSDVLEDEFGSEVANIPNMSPEDAAGVIFKKVIGGLF